MRRNTACMARLNTTSAISVLRPYHYCGIKEKSVRSTASATTKQYSRSVSKFIATRSVVLPVLGQLDAIRASQPFTPRTMAFARSTIPVTCRLSQPLPKGTIDSHMHIIPPDFDKFPILPSAQYKPTPHTLIDAEKFYRESSGLGIATPRLILTQVSIYGHDNSALLSGVAELKGNARGVVECDPKTITVGDLQSWWMQGVRGVRINLVSVGRSMDKDELYQNLQAYVDKLVQHQLPEGKGWVVEMFLPLKMIPVLLNVLPEIKNGNRVRWCLDHFAGLKMANDCPKVAADHDPYQITGFGELVQLLTDPALPEVYVKISAQYRVDAGYPSQDALRRLRPIGQELISKAEDRVIWASDWPHTRFENIDSVPFVEACYSWCGEGTMGEDRRQKLFRLNSEKLWDMAPSQP